MTEAEKNPNRLILKISLAGHEELHNYQKGIWLIDRVNIKAIKSWTDYIEEEYAEKSISINADLLFKEVLELRKKQSVEKV